jgi:hypothetical protein
LIRVYEQLKKRGIDAHELFNAIDTDSNMQLSCTEIKSFIEALVNGEEKVLLDKDIRIFMNFMDTDKSSQISKGEFLR